MITILLRTIKLDHINSKIQLIMMMIVEKEISVIVLVRSIMDTSIILIMKLIIIIAKMIR